MPKILHLDTEHPLKRDLQLRRITLWELRSWLGGQPSEFKLSRMLNGIEKMDRRVENGIAQMLGALNTLSEV